MDRQSALSPACRLAIRRSPSRRAGPLDTTLQADKALALKAYDFSLGNGFTSK